MKPWTEETADEYYLANNPYGGRHHVVSYDARTLKGGDSLSAHDSLLTARIAAFFAVLRGDRRVVIVSGPAGE